VISATCVYAHTVGGEHPERAEQALELGDLFCRQSRRRVESLFAALWANEDEANYSAAQRVLEGRYTWLEEGIIDPSGEGPMLGGTAEPSPAPAESNVA
jgi:hypothetical protein